MGSFHCVGTCVGLLGSYVNRLTNTKPAKKLLQVFSLPIGQGSPSYTAFYVLVLWFLESVYYG